MRGRINDVTKKEKEENPVRVNFWVSSKGFFFREGVIVLYRLFWEQHGVDFPWKNVPIVKTDGTHDGFPFFLG